MSQQTICAAIRDKKCLRFRYKNEVRVVEPHLLGYDSDGDLTLSAWQVSGTRPDWRDFHVAKISGLTTTEQNVLKPRQGYNPRDETIDRVVCRL